MKTPTTFAEMYDLVEASVAAKVTAAGGAPVKFGRSEADAHGFKDSRAISMYPHSGQASRADNRGGRRHTGTNPTNPLETEDVTDPTPLWDRGLLFLAQVYEKDLDGCNELGGHLVSALEDKLGGRAKVEGEEWDTSGKVSRGRVLVVTFRLAAQWYTTPYPTVVPTSYEQTTNLQAPT